MTTRQKATQLALTLVGPDQNPEPLIEVLIDMAQWQYNQIRRNLMWKKVEHPHQCWSGEIAAHPFSRTFTYENYTINADKLFKLLPKEK